MNRIKRLIACGLVAAMTQAGLGQTTMPQPLQAYEAGGGRKIRAGFVPYKEEVVWGEPLEVTLVVENAGAGEVAIEFGGDYRGFGRHNRFRIMVKDEGGKELPDPKANGFDMGGLISVSRLKAGERFSHAVDLTQFRTFAKPGVYRVECAYALSPERTTPPAEGRLPVVTGAYTLTILERTPERTARVLNESVERARKASNADLPAILERITAFGGEAAATPLLGLVDGADLARRVMIIGALGRAPGDLVREALVRMLEDGQAEVRSAAAAALGGRSDERTVEALMAAFERERILSAKRALLHALGNSKSERGLALLVRLARDSDTEMQRAAVGGLGANRSDAALEALRQMAATAQNAVRFEAAFMLGNNLRQPLEVEWLWPILLDRQRGEPWYGTISLMRLYTGKRAVGAYLACLDWEAPWSSRNWWILEQGVKPTPGAPVFEYAYDPNRAGTAEEIEKNRAVLEKLKPLAEKLPGEIAALRERGLPAPKRMTQAVPAGHETSMVEVSPGEYRIQSGFLVLKRSQNGGSVQFSVWDEYRPMYEIAYALEYLAAHPELEKKLGLTAEQVEALRVLGPPEVGSYGPLPEEHELFWNFREAPEGKIKERARKDLLAAIEVSAHDCHGRVVEFVQGAQKVLTEEQVAKLKEVVAESKRAGSR